MRKEMPGYYFDKEVKNGNKSFIKYVDGAIIPETIIFVLNKNGTCRFQMHYYEDQTKIQIKRSEFNKKYRKIGKDLWLTSYKGKPYTIEIEQKDWYFIVHTRKK